MLKHNFSKPQSISEHKNGANPCIKCNGRDIPLDQLKSEFRKKVFAIENSIMRHRNQGVSGMMNV